MDSARNQLLPGACFARNQYRSVGRRDSHDAGEDSFQGRRRAYNLLKHQDLIDLLSQRDVLLLRSLLGLFAIFDIDSGRVPANGAALLIAQRVVTDEKPALLSIMPVCSLFVFKWNAAQECFSAFLSNPLHVLWMEHPRAKVIRLQVFK